MRLNSLIRTFLGGLLRRPRDLEAVETHYWSYRRAVRQWLEQLRDLAIEMGPECAEALKQRFDLQRVYMDRTDKRLKYLMREDPGRLNTASTFTDFVDSVDKRWREEDDTLLAACCPEYSSLLSAIARMHAEARESSPNVDAVFDRVRSSARYTELANALSRQLELLV